MTCPTVFSSFSASLRPSIHHSQFPWISHRAYLITSKRTIFSSHVTFSQIFSRVGRVEIWFDRQTEVEGKIPRRRIEDRIRLCSTWSIRDNPNRRCKCQRTDEEREVFFTEFILAQPRTTCVIVLSCIAAVTQNLPLLKSKIDLAVSLGKVPRHHLWTLQSLPDSPWTYIL